MAMTGGGRELFDRRPWQRLELGDSAPWGFLGKREGHLLYHLARDYCTGAGVLVDAGAFLGCSAWYFAQGLAGNPAFGEPRPWVHCFDNFIVNEPVTTDAIERQFGEHLGAGASTRHLFDAQTRGIRAWLEVHHGDFHTCEWPARPIEVLLVDIAKAPSLNRRVFELFFPCLIPGRSVVVHQDYHHPWLPHIHVAMECVHDYFELVEPKVDDSAAFLLTRAIPAEVLARAARSHELPFDEQLALMDRALTRLPVDARRHVELARAHLLGQGRGYAAMREAMDALDARYPAVDPDDFMWARNRGEMLGLLAEVRSDLVRGWHLVQAGDAAGGLAVGEAVAPGDKRYVDALVLRGHCLRRLGRKDEALPLIDEAVARRPDSAPSWIERAWLGLEFRRHAQAVDDARRAIACATDSSQVAFGHNVLALALSLLGRHEEAIVAGQAAVAAAPNAPWLLVHQAQCLQRAGRAPEAVRLATRALELQPGDAAAQAVIDAAGKPRGAARG
jgi:tetratricopeptide (TPR) repeat protein